MEFLLQSRFAYNLIKWFQFPYPQTGLERTSEWSEHPNGVNIRME